MDIKISKKHRKFDRKCQIPVLVQFDNLKFRIEIQSPSKKCSFKFSDLFYFIQAKYFHFFLLKGFKK